MKMTGLKAIIPSRAFLISILAIGLVSVGVVIFLNWAVFSFRADLLRLSVDGNGAPSWEGRPEGNFSINTNSDEVSSRAIGAMYYVACGRLESLRGPYRRRTYHWYDAEGWDRVTSVVQFSSGYMYVTASCNNDNDCVSAGVFSGIFPPADHPWYTYMEMKELPDDRLPEHTLRFQQGQE